MQRNVKALISMILGIVGVVCGFCGGGGIPFAIAALILSGLATRDDKENGQAKLGKILGIVGIVISVIAFIVMIIIASNLS